VALLGVKGELGVHTALCGESTTETELLSAGMPFESPFGKLTVLSNVEGLKAPSETEEENRRDGPPYRNLEDGAFLRKAFTPLLMFGTPDSQSLHQRLEGGSFEAQDFCGSALACHTPFRLLQDVQEVCSLDAFEV
jgi:hypothetical protein